VVPGEGWFLGRDWAVWAGAGKERAGSGQGTGRGQHGEWGKEQAEQGAGREWAGSG